MFLQFHDSILNQTMDMMKTQTEEKAEENFETRDPFDIENEILENEIKAIKRELEIKTFLEEKKKEELKQSYEGFKEQTKIGRDKLRDAKKAAFTIKKELNIIKNSLLQGRIDTIENKVAKEFGITITRKELKNKVTKIIDGDMPPLPNEIPEEIEDEEINIRRELLEVRLENKNLKRRNVELKAKQSQLQESIVQTLRGARGFKRAKQVETYTNEDDDIPSAPSDDIEFKHSNSNTDNVVAELKQKLASMRAKRPNFFKETTIELVGKGIGC